MLDDDGVIVLEEVKKKYGDRFEIWQDWTEIPRNATFVDFQQTTAKQFEFNDIYTSDDDFLDYKSNGSIWQVVLAHKSVKTPRGRLSQKSLEPLREWFAILGKIWNTDKEKWKEEGGCCLRLDKIAKFLPPTHGR